MPVEKKQFYIPCLDGIRALAVLTVIVAHTGYGGIIPGGFGVTVFFFLSGYLITTLLRLESIDTGTISIRNFYIRRIYRILPPMYVTIAIVSLLAWLHVVAGPVKWKGIALTSVFFTNYLWMFNLDLPPYGLTTLWSLAVEEHFYLLFPLLYLFMVSRRTSRLWQSVSIAISCLLVLSWRIYLIYFLHRPTGNIGRVYLYTDTRIDSILFGCLLAVSMNPIIDELPGWIRENAGKLALLGLAVMAFSLTYRDELFRDTFRYSLQGISLMLAFLFIVAAPERRSARWLEQPVLKYVGRRSYVLYLIQTTVAFELVRHHIRPPYTLPATLLICIAYGEAMDRLVEEPMRKLKRRSMRGSFHQEVTTPEDGDVQGERLSGPLPDTGAPPETGAA